MCGPKRLHNPHPSCVFVGSDLHLLNGAPRAALRRLALRRLALRRRVGGAGPQPLRFGPRPPLPARSVAASPKRAALRRLAGWRGGARQGVEAPLSLSLSLSLSRGSARSVFCVEPLEEPLGFRPSPRARVWIRARAHESAPRSVCARACVLAFCVFARARVCARARP